ncbi:MAG: hypothetical protein IKQ47_05430 [Prevotella sp.]|nr:hypothetical protein [Prevotella sp.]
MRKTITLLLLALLTSVGAWAETEELDPVGVFTWTNTPAITYDATATSWTINQGGITGGKIGRYAGPYAIVKFDASSILDGNVLLTATLDFDITAGAYNSSINIALMASASFDPSTVTTAAFNATATQFQAGGWSTKNATVHFSYDVKNMVDTAHVLAFAIYTNTAREQTLKNVKLNIQYSAEEVSKYNYSLKAVDANNVEIKTLVEGEEFETNSVTAYFPYMFEKDGVLYKTTQTPYNVTFSKDNTSSTVTYAEAGSEIVAYMEGESATEDTGENAAYSNGKNGYSAGNKTTTLATLPEGKYTATIYLVGNGNRSIVIRNTANTDVTTNTIISLPISKTSAAGVYTSDEFVITDETTVGFSGYTSDTKTNQSANIDYIYITKTGDITEETVTVAEEGTSTYVTKHALDFSTIEGLTVLIATDETQGYVELSKVTQVPAGAPIIVKGEAGDYSVPVCDATTYSDNLTNKLEGDATASYTVTADDNIYAIKKDKSEFRPVAVGVEIPAKKAYFRSIYPVNANAKPFIIRGEEEDPTAVTTVEVVEAAKAKKFFNAAGQQVDENYKGFVITSAGKKIINK